MSNFIHSWKIQIFKHQDLDEAKKVAYSLHSRGYKRVGLHDKLIGEQFKTYATIKTDKRKGAVKYYCVEFMSPSERWG